MIDYLKSFFPTNLMDEEYGKYWTIAFEKIQDLVELDTSILGDTLSLDLLKMFSKHPKAKPTVLYCHTALDIMKNCRTLLDDYKKLQDMHKDYVMKTEGITKEKQSLVDEIEQLKEEKILLIRKNLTTKKAHKHSKQLVFSNAEIIKHPLFLKKVAELRDCQKETQEYLQEL